MANDLIKKNAELGRFLFCERYTLQPVKNALYIAEGQDLKRGAVVDVNGVLVGTNSLMPYAVLENDCDTRAKGAFASVFVKGEFNFDKLFFADGLSKDDIDNIVYNGSGIGLVIKPYDYEKGFIPKQQEQMEQVKKQENINRIILDQIYNPLSLPDKTIRCKFTSGYTPTMGTSRTIVDADENVWDITKNSNSWSELFKNITNLVAVIGANTSSITSMSNMFQGCTSLSSVSLFDTSKVFLMQYMFRSCTSLTSVPLFDTSNVENMNAMFSGCTSLTSVPLFDTSKATSMYEMFKNCTSLTSVPLFDTSKATSIYSMFDGCTSLTSVPLFDISSVITMESMFHGCTSLTSVPLFDTSSVTNMNYMFDGCTSLTSVPLFDTSSVTTMSSMFSGCTSLTSVPLFNTSSVYSMNYMFSGCTSLTSVPLFDTSSVYFMNSMFYGCTSLSSIPLFDTSSVTTMKNMFEGCTAVTEGALALYQRASSKNPQPSHNNTFTNCGKDTITGAAELAQIPTSWGGMAA